VTKVTLISSRDRGSPKRERPDSLYEKRNPIYPKLAHGKFRSVKWLVMAATLGVYYLIPWIRWPRGEGIPDQAVLADFDGEKFYFFFLEIWPQEIYFLGGLIILSALALFLVTSLFGRVWCGYACPQTVWTDLYIWVERAFEGDRAARLRRDHGPLSLNKALRKSGKHLVWLLIAFVTGGAFILYWHDAPMIARTFFVGEAPLTAYFFAAVLTFTTYVLAGTMREQVCTYLCPWPRIQGALTDEYALNVTYRFDRGEPRGPLHKDQGFIGRGDCIDCKQCIQVCPMGIDIRDGAQLECIHCALCIDACDAIMRKVGRPTGLIAYDTDKAISQRAAGEKPRYKFLRARIALYTVLIALVGSLILWGYASKSIYEFNVLKDRSPAFIRLSDGGVRNGYTLKLVNKSTTGQTVEISIHGLTGAEFEIVGVGAAPTGGQLTLAPEAHGVDRYRMLVTLPSGKEASGENLVVQITDPDSGEAVVASAPFTTGGR
jgi:cytochrome c oxidase accessory protein FixG